MSRVLTHPQEIERLLAGRHGIPDLDLEAMLDGMAVGRTHRQGDGHMHLWSADGCECRLCGACNHTSAHLAACGPCRIEEEERWR